jgi:hypothetical protein
MKYYLKLLALLAVFTALGLLSSYEVWQGLGFEKIGLRNGGVVRAETPMLFWTRFAVELMFASVFWLTVLFFALIGVLHLRAGRK